MAVLSDAVSGVSEKMKDVVFSTLAFTSNCNIFLNYGNFYNLCPVRAASYNGFCIAFFVINWSSKDAPLNDHECTPQRLNHLMILSVPRNCAESLNVQ